ncbi:MAG TPA: DUF2236 domain-containing protein, partial [Telluria sp.]|nr:DUF2236 domain-containing protein [Telluria sp.]
MTHLDAQVAAAAALPDTCRTDPLADSTIARIFGPREGAPDTLFETAGLVNRLIAQWQTNAQTAAWQAPPGTPPHIAAALQDYLRSGTRLPDWADPARI